MSDLHLTLFNLMQDTIYGHSRQRNRVADKKSLGSIKHIYSYLPCVVLCIAKRWHKGLKLLDFFFSFFLFILLFLCKSCHFLVLASPCHFNLPTEKDKCRKLGIYHSMTENQRSKATPCWNDKKKNHLERETAMNASLKPFKTCESSAPKWK